MSPRVLIIDDEPMLRRALERVLRSAGCDVVTAGDPYLAYEVLDETDVDLVLLDLHLPQMSGDTLFLALTRRWPRLTDRIILMTGDCSPETAHWPPELCRCTLLLKPFTIDVLRRTVLQALHGSDQRRAGGSSA